MFERYHLPAIRALKRGSPRSDGVVVHLVAACETDAGRRAWAKRALAGLPCVERLDDLIDSAAADAVLVSTPPATHAAIARSLLRAGLHVLVEKPMTVGLEAAQELHATQREAKRVLRVGFNRRYRTSYARLRHRVQSEGGATTVGFTFVADAARWNPSVNAAAPDFLLNDAGSHALDLVAHVAGAPIESVCATVEDSALTHIVRIDARLSREIQASCTIGHGNRYQEQLVADGGRGEHHVDSSGQSSTSRLRIKAQLGFRRLTRRPTPTDESFQAQLAAFAAACQGRDDGIGAGVDDGMASVAAVDACIASIANAGAWSAITPQVIGTGERR